jgi:hypothetical protein
MESFRVQPGGLLEAFLAYGDVDSLELQTKKALRLCSKQIQSRIDASPVAFSVELMDLKQFLQCSWRVGVLTIRD